MRWEGNITKGKSARNPERSAGSDSATHPVLGLAGESELVLGLAVRDFVDAECDEGKETAVSSEHYLCYSAFGPYSPEPLVGGADHWERDGGHELHVSRIMQGRALAILTAGQVALDVLNVSELAGKGVIDCNVKGKRHQRRRCQ